MRYMFLVSGAETNATPPPQRMIDEIEKLAEQDMAAGRMIARGGLLPTAMGARVESRRGKLKLTDGPFTETKEVLGGFAIYEFPTREEAIAAAKSFMELHSKYWPEWEGVCEMRPMFGFGATAAATVDEAAPS